MQSPVDIVNKFLTSHLDDILAQAEIESETQAKQLQIFKERLNKLYEFGQDILDKSEQQQTHASENGIKPQQKHTANPPNDENKKPKRDKPEKPEKPEKTEKPEKQEKQEKQEKPDKKQNIKDNSNTDKKNIRDNKTTKEQKETDKQTEKDKVERGRKKTDIEKAKDDSVAATKEDETPKKGMNRYSSEGQFVKVGLNQKNDKDDQKKTIADLKKTPLPTTKIKNDLSTIDEKSTSTKNIQTKPNTTQKPKPNQQKDENDKNDKTEKTDKSAKGNIRNTQSSQPRPVDTKRPATAKPTKVTAKEEENKEKESDKKNIKDKDKDKDKERPKTSVQNKKDTKEPKKTEGKSEQHKEKPEKSEKHSKNDSKKQAQDTKNETKTEKNNDKKHEKESNNTEEKDKHDKVNEDLNLQDKFLKSITTITKFIIQLLKSYMDQDIDQLMLSGKKVFCELSTHKSEKIQAEINKINQTLEQLQKQIDGVVNTQKEKFVAGEIAKSSLGVIEPEWIENLYQKDKLHKNIQDLLKIYFLLEGSHQIIEFQNDHNKFEQYCKDYFKTNQDQIISKLSNLLEQSEFPINTSIQIESVLDDNINVLDTNTFESTESSDDLCGVLSLLIKDICDYMGVYHPSKLSNDTNKSNLRNIYLYNLEKLKFYQNKLTQIQDTKESILGKS